MLFFWRINKQIDEFSTSLADELYSQITPDMLKTANKRISRQWDKNIEGIILRIKEYKSTHGLGIYRKARLHQTFMSRLEVHGFPKELIKELNEHLLLKTP